MSSLRKSVERSRPNEEDVDGILDQISDNDEFEFVGDNAENIEDIINQEDDLEEAKTEIKSPTKEPAKGTPAPLKKTVTLSLRDSPQHPLEILEQQERDISMKLGKQLDLDTKFVLSNQKITGDQSHSSVVFTVLDRIVEHIFPDQANRYTYHNNEFWGTPRCIAILPHKWIALGMSRAVAVVFDYGMQTLIKMGTQKEEPYGAITAMDICARDDQLLCGHEFGHLVLWSIKRNEHLKTFTPLNDIMTPICQIKFWKEGTSNVIVSNGQGIVQLLSFSNSFFGMSAERRMLLDASDAAAKKKNSTEKDPFAHLCPAFFSVQVIKKEHLKGHHLNKYTLVALASAKTIYVASLEPVISIVYDYQRPNDIADMNMPSVSWGRGAIPGPNGEIIENKHPLLAISWGMEVQLFQFQNVEEEDRKGVKFVGIWKPQEEISHMEFISENLLIIYDMKKMCRILYTGYFQVPTDKKKVAHDAKAIIFSQCVDPEISYQTIKDPEEKKKVPVFYTNTMIGLDHINRVFILGYKKMFVGRLWEWDEYLKVLVDRADWLSAFSLGIQIMNGTNKLFADVPNNQKERKEALIPLFSEFILSYINSVSKALRDFTEKEAADHIKTLINVTQDFLISVGHYNFLFMECRNIFKNLGYQTMFLENLEPFILKNRIKTIPNDAFREVINFYTSKKKIDVLQYLMINLDLEDLDVDNAITLCMENNLLSPLMYLCSHRENGNNPDFLTPIARALSTYQKLQDEYREKEETTTPGGDKMKDQNKGIIPTEEQKQDYLEYGMKFLWFVNITLRGRMFPFGAIPEKIWAEKVKDIVILIFEEGNLELMISIEPFVAFETLRILFEPKLASQIEMYDPKSVKIIGNLNDPVPTESEEKEYAKERARKTGFVGKDLREHIHLFSETIENRLYAQILALIYYCGQKNQIYHNHLYYLFANISVGLGFLLPQTVLKKILNYILDTPRNVPKWEKVRRKIDEYSEREVFHEERAELILELLKRIKLNPDEYQHLIRKIDHTDFIDARVFLHELRQDYPKCIDIYITSGNSQSKNKIFKWFSELVKALRTANSEHFKVVKDTIINKITDLVKINPDSTRRLISNLDSNLEADAIKQLDAFPQLQYDYLKLITAQREYGVKIADDLLALHVKLLCKLDKKKELIKELRENNYPLDECLRICKEADIREAVAILTEKTGNAKEALDLMLEIFNERLAKKVKKLEERSEFSGVGLERRINEAKDVCLKYNKRGDADSELLWYNVLDRLIENYHTYISKNKNIIEAEKDIAKGAQAECYKKFAEVYRKLISSLFEDISKNVSVDSIMSKLTDYKNLSLGDLKNAFISMLQTYFYESKILKDAKTLIVGDTFEHVAELYHKTARGVRTDKSGIDGDLVDKLVLFACGHLFPRSYVQGNLCALCSDSEILRVSTIIQEAKKALKTGRQAPRQMTNVPGRTESLLVPGTGETRTTLTDDRTRLKNAIDQRGSLYSSSANEIKEKYLRKLRIFDQKKVEDGKDIQWDEFTDSAIFQ